MDTAEIKNENENNKKRKLTKGASSAIAGFIAISGIFGATALYVANADTINRGISDTFNEIARELVITSIIQQYTR